MAGLLHLTVSTPKYYDQQRKHNLHPFYELLHDTPLEHTNG